MSLDGRDLPVAIRGKAFMFGLPSTTQTISFSETATSSAAVATGAYCVRMVADQPVAVAFATTPTATTATSMRLAANWPEYFYIQPSQKVSAVKTGATNGTLYITEML